MPGRFVLLVLVTAASGAALALASSAQSAGPNTVTVTAPSAPKTPTATATVIVPAATTSTTKPTAQELQTEIDALNHSFDRILIVFTILVGILALGGALGVVFSIRDQRRVSQLHELTVNAELSNQRRAEQSYGAFLEGSQKTLTLVNDTLELAKEASAQAAHNMDLKARSNLETIETAAEDFVLEVAEKEDFEGLVDVPDNRARVRTLARELDVLQGYLSLQNIQPPPYIAFLKGIDEYLNDETTTARQMLRRSAQDTSTRQLQRMARFWVAEFDNALGNYGQAARILDLAETDAPPNSVEQLELRRARAQAEFFEIASGSDELITPIARLREVTSLLGLLETTAQSLGEKTKHAEQHVNHEVAVTRANIYAWIAYEPDDLYRALDGPAIERATPFATGPSYDGIISFAAMNAEIPEDIANLDDEALRAWAHLQAERIYSHQHDFDETDDLDFRLLFGKAETDFALGLPGEEEEYRRLEHRAYEDQLGGHREHRHVIELAHLTLICKARQLKLARDSKASAESRTAAGSAVDAAAVRVIDALGSTPDHNVTIFSHLQRRNVAQEELRDEAKVLQRHALKPPKRRAAAA